MHCDSQPLIRSVLNGVPGQACVQVVRRLVQVASSGVMSDCPFVYVKSVFTERIFIKLDFEEL